MAWFRHRILESTLLLKPTTHGPLDPYDPINRVVQKEAILKSNGIFHHKDRMVFLIYNNIFVLRNNTPMIMLYHQMYQFDYNHGIITIIQLYTINLSPLLVFDNQIVDTII